MDTIIYFRKKKGLKEPVAEPIGMRSHMLIRVELDVGQEEWFGVKLGMRSEIPSSQENRDRETDGDLQAVKGQKGGKRKAGYCQATGCRESLGGTKSSQTENISRRIWAICHPLQAIGWLRRQRKEMRQEKERRYAEEQEEKRFMAQRAENIRKTETAIEKLVSVIKDLAGDFHDCYCVYDDSVRKWLVSKESDLEEDADRMWQEVREMLEWDRQGPQTERENQERQNRQPDSILSALWRHYFPVEEFKGYTKRFWVEQLIPKASNHHFVILGTAPCLFEVIEQCAPRMKSLRWILPEDDCSEEMLDLVEDFYVEYGLAITLQSISYWTKENPASLKRLHLVCEQPANILDFTGEAYIAVSEVAEGSVWLDMLSVEEKQRRIRNRGGGIVYFSLKEKWRQAQRPQPFIPASNEENSHACMGI